MWGFAWHKKELRWPSSGPPASACHSAEVTLVVTWRVNAVSWARIKDDCTARLWQLGDSEPFRHHFLSPESCTHPTPRGPSFLAVLLVCLPGWRSSPQHLLEAIVNSNDSTAGSSCGRRAMSHASAFWRPGCLKWTYDGACTVGNQVCPHLRCKGGTTTQCTPSSLPCIPSPDGLDSTDPPTGNNMTLRSLSVGPPGVPLCSPSPSSHPFITNCSCSPCLFLAEMRWGVPPSIHTST